jgi:hypothetical protein
MKLAAGLLNPCDRSMALRAVHETTMLGLPRRSRRPSPVPLVCGDRIGEVPVVPK